MSLYKNIKMQVLALSLVMGTTLFADGNTAPTIDGVAEPLSLAVESDVTSFSDKTGQRFEVIGQTFTWNTDKSLGSVAINPWFAEKKFIFTIYDGETLCDGTVLSEQNLTFAKTSFTLSPTRLTTPVNLVNGSKYTMCFAPQAGGSSVIMRSNIRDSNNDYVSIYDGGHYISEGIINTGLDLLFQLNPPLPQAPLSASIAENTTFAYDVNASDNEGDTLTYSIVDGLDASSFVIDSATGVLSFVSAPDFEIPADTDVNNVYTLVVKVSDGTLANNATVEITVTNVDPTLEAISDRIYYKNFRDKNITLAIHDIDNTSLTYTTAIAKTDIIDTITFTNNIMIIHSLSAAFGDTNVTVYVSDGEYNDSKVFNIQVLSFESGLVEEEASPTEINDVNGTKTYSNQIGSDVNITRVEDNNGSVSHEIAVGGKTIKSIFDLNGSTVTTTPSGVHTTYSDANVSVEVNATVTGKATHSLTVNGKIAQATSEVNGAKTHVFKDINGSVEIDTSIKVGTSDINVIAKADGTAEHTVKTDSNTTSKVTSSVAGAKTVIKASEVETDVDTPPVGGEFFRVIAKTTTDGKTVTSFQKIDNTGAVLQSFDTFQAQTPYAPGNEVKIYKKGTLYIIETKAPLVDDLKVQ